MSIYLPCVVLLRDYLRSVNPERQCRRGLRTRRSHYPVSPDAAKRTPKPHAFGVRTAMTGRHLANTGSALTHPALRSCPAFALLFHHFEQRKGRRETRALPSERDYLFTVCWQRTHSQSWQAFHPVRNDGRSYHPCPHGTTPIPFRWVKGPVPRVYQTPLGNPYSHPVPPGFPILSFLLTPFAPLHSFLPIL
ncbi:hypothetical protein BJV78DRAFT_701948 [Lactifluus subvellereus]|nr:hypothetical protein BJV78DRAFT_701948 [Lactifluus subvellereus]